MKPEAAVEKFLASYATYTTSPAFLQAEGQDQWQNHFNYVHNLIQQLKRDIPN